MPIGYLSLVAVLLASGVIVVLIRSHRLESELKDIKPSFVLTKRICAERKCYCISSQTKNILDQTSSLRQAALKYLEARCERIVHSPHLAMCTTMTILPITSKL